MSPMPTRAEAAGLLPALAAFAGADGPGPALPDGVSALRLAPGPDALVRRPPAARGALPLLLLLHGAGGTAAQAMALALGRPEAAEAVLLAPPSRSATWDMIGGAWGPDVRFIGQAMAHVAARIRIDPARVVVGGFSDGASYALSLGLTNGRLFRAILAFSPGFAAPMRPEGQPEVFISHGTADAVLPIDQCSRRLVPRLRAAGYDVRYREFTGGHVVPPELAAEAFAWALRPE
jgi:phospholipase/carboxylesterase